MEWKTISTPPENRNLIVVTDGFTFEITRRYNLWQGEKDYGFGEWDYQITHWCELPELPKEV